MSENTQEESFFERFLGAIFNKKDPEAIKKRQLKQIAKSLSKTRYKFYKPSSDQILPSFAKFFYEIYKAVSPSQLMFNTQQNPNAYKTMVVDYALSEEQKQMLEMLTEESITTMSSNMPFDQLQKKIKECISLVSSNFTKDKINQIDALYSKLMIFKSICTFDFYFLLKKFDSTLHENEFSSNPNFNTIDASYISEDLKDFVSVAWTLPLNEDWTDVMQYLKTTRGVEPIKPVQWTKIVSRLKQIRISGAFEMMIQLITKDPKFEPKVEMKTERIVESYIEKIKTQAQLTVKKLENEQKNSKIDSLVTQIFNSSAVFSTKYYTEAASAIFAKRGYQGYEYARPLNYLKAFLVEYVKKDVREFSDLVLIRGKWSAQELSQKMSNDFNFLMETSEKIINFDKKHNEENGEIGMKLKMLLPRADRDKESANIIRTTFRDSNSIAKEFLVTTTRTLVAFAKTTKSVIEDYKKQRPELITNWKELERFTEHPISELSVGVYKKIYLFVNLMQSYLQ